MNEEQKKLLEIIIAKKEEDISSTKEAIANTQKGLQQYIYGTNETIAMLKEHVVKEGREVKILKELLNELEVKQ